MKKILCTFKNPLLLWLLLWLASMIPEQMLAKDTSVLCALIIFSAAALAQKLADQQEHSLTKTVWKTAAVSVAAAFSYSAAIAIVIEILPNSYGMSDVLTSLLSHLSDQQLYSYTLCAFFLLPLCTEYAYRISCYQQLRTIFSADLSILLAAVFYALFFWQYSGNLYVAVFAFLSGILFALISERTGSWLFCSLAHAASTTGLMMSYVSLLMSRTAAIVLAVCLFATAVFLILYLMNSAEDQAQKTDQDSQE